MKPGLFRRLLGIRRVASAEQGPVIRAGFGSSGAALNSDSFEALRSSPDRTPINVQSLTNLRNSAGSWWQTMSAHTRRESLASLARYVADNYGIVGYALGLVQNFSVPINPKAMSADPEWNQLADQYFEDWSWRCDYSGRFDRDTLQRLICVSLDVDGDIGITMDASHGWPQLRFWPTWRIGKRMGEVEKNMVEGVILDDDDAVRGYQVAVSPGDWRILDANQMLLLYEPNRWERYRGLSALRSGLNDIRDVADIKGFLKLGTKVESAIAAVVQSRNGLDEADWEDRDNPSTKPSSAVPKGFGMAQLFGGDIPVIDGEIKQLKSETPGTNKLEFMDKLAGYFVAGLEIPPAFYLDEKLTGPNQRSVISKAQKKFDSRKRTMTRLARWEWVRVIGDAIARGILPPVDGWQRCKIQSPPQLSIDFGDTAKAMAEAVREGRISRQQYHAAAGEDWQDTEDQNFREDDYILTKAQQQAEKFDVPLELILSRHAFAQKSAPAASQSATAEEDAMDQEDPSTDPQQDPNKEGEDA